MRDYGIILDQKKMKRPRLGSRQYDVCRAMGGEGVEKIKTVAMGCVLVTLSPLWQAEVRWKDRQ
jgi:hypothetical protein